MLVLPAKSPKTSWISGASHCSDRPLLSVPKELIWERLTEQSAVRAAFHQNKPLFLSVEHFGVHNVELLRKHRS